MSSSQPIKARVFRGQHGAMEEAGALHTRQGSITFSGLQSAFGYATNPNDNNDTAQAPRVLMADIVINNPVYVDKDDPFFDVLRIKDIGGMEAVWEFIEEFSGEITYMQAWDDLLEEYDELLTVKEMLEEHPESLNRLAMTAFPVFNSPKWTAFFKDHGFDGVVHAGFGDFEEAEYKIFDPAQAQVVKVYDCSGHPVSDVLDPERLEAIRVALGAPSLEFEDEQELSFG